MNIKQLNPQILEGRLAQLNGSDLDEMSGQSMALLHQVKTYRVEAEAVEDLPFNPNEQGYLYEKYHQQLHQLAEKMTFRFLLKRIFCR